MVQQNSNLHLVADQVMEIIDDFVEEEVRRNLEEIIPVELQSQVVEQKRQLEEVRRSLHNSFVFSLLSKLSGTDFVRRIREPC